MTNVIISSFSLAFLLKSNIIPIMNHIPELVIFCIFAAFAIPISIIDIRSRRIPDVLSFPCFFLLLLARLLLSTQPLFSHLAAALLGPLLFLGVRAATSGLGLGDVKFAAVIGLFCGFPSLLAAFLIAALLGIIATLLLTRHSACRPFPVPFAPFLTAGALLVYGIWMGAGF
jgi:prepilin signal peptidase PulO-like enzyme (type II secretory pathway)